MAKNVITYGVQDLFFGNPVIMPPHKVANAGGGSSTVFGSKWSITGYTGQKTNGANDGQKFEVLQRINKVQNFNYSIDLPKENINSIGSITNRGSYVSGPPSVNLNFSYYVDGINNEQRMGFSTQNQTANLPTSFVSGLMAKETDRKNIYLAIDNTLDEAPFSIRTQDPSEYPSPPTGQPFMPVTGVIDPNAGSYDFLVFVNSYINSYSVNMGVGEVPTVNVGAVADNVFFTKGVDTGFGVPYINTENATTGFSGVSVAVPKNFIDNVNTFNYPKTVFMPGDIKLSLSRTNPLSYQSDWSSSTDGWSSIRMVSLTSASTIDGVSDALRAAGDGSENTHYIARSNSFTIGKRYRVNGRAYVKPDPLGSVLGGVYLYNGNGSESNEIRSYDTLNAWFDFGEEFIATSTDLNFFARHIAGGTTVTMKTSDSIYLKDVTIEEMRIDFDHGTVQSCNIDLDLTRENIQYMGHKLPWDRPVTTPVGITAGFDVVVSGDTKGSLMEDFVYNGLYNLNIDFMTGDVLAMNYKLSGLRLDSAQYDSSIGSNKTASLSFSSDFSLDDNFNEIIEDKGFFVSGRVIQIKERFLYSGISTSSMGGIGTNQIVDLRSGTTTGQDLIKDDQNQNLFPRY